MASIQLQTLGAVGTGNIAQLDSTYPQAVFTIRPTQNITVSKLQFAVSRASSSTTPFVRAFIRPNAGNATYKSAPTASTPLATTSGDANGWFSAANFSTSAPTSSFYIAPNIRDFPFQSPVTLQANTDYTIHIEFDVKGNSSNQLKLYGGTASSANGNSWKVLANNLFSVDSTNYSNLNYYPFISVAGTTSTSLVENGILSYSSDYRSLGNYSNNTYLHSTFTAGQSVTLNQISAQLSWYNDLYGSASSYGGNGPSFNVTIFAASTTYPYRPTGQALASSNYIYLKNNVVYNSQNNADYGNLFAIPLTGSVTLQASTKYAIVFRLNGNDQRDNLRIFSGGSMLLESFIGTDTATSSSTGTWSPYYEYRSVYQAMTNITLSTASIAENTASGVTIGSFSTTNGTSPYTYAFSGGLADNAAFSISGNNLVTSSALDFETKSSYSIQVSATDAASNTYAKAFTISVTNVNERPASITLSASSIAENNAIGAAVGTLSAINPDTGLELPFSIKNGFIFSSSALSAFNAAHSGTVQEIVLKTTDNLAPSTSNLGNNVNLDYTKSYVKVGGVKYYAYTVAGNVRSSSGTQMGLVGNDLSASTSSSFNYGINFNGGWVLTFSSSSVSLNKYDAITDMDTTGYFSFTGSRVFASLPAWVDKFQISGSQLQAKMAFDYESAASHSVVVEATDTDGVSIEQTFTISVTNANEAPTNISLSLSTIAENNAINAVIGTLSTTDPDAGNTFTYSLSGTDAASFNISGSSLRAFAVFDYETKSSYSINVISTDQGGLTYTKAFTISVTNDASDDSILVSSASMILEKVVARVGVNPRNFAVRTVISGVEQALPEGSVVANTTNGQKFVKVVGGEKEFFAISIAASVNWGWTQEARDAWDILQGF